MLAISAAIQPRLAHESAPPYARRAFLFQQSRIHQLVRFFKEALGLLAHSLLHSLGALHSRRR